MDEIGVREEKHLMRNSMPGGGQRTWGQQHLMLNLTLLSVHVSLHYPLSFLSPQQSRLSTRAFCSWCFGKYRKKERTAYGEVAQMTVALGGQLTHGMLQKKIQQE